MKQQRKVELGLCPPLPSCETTDRSPRSPSCSLPDPQGPVLPPQNEDSAVRQRLATSCNPARFLGLGEWERQGHSGWRLQRGPRWPQSASIQSCGSPGRTLPAGPATPCRGPKPTVQGPEPLTLGWGRSDGRKARAGVWLGVTWESSGTCYRGEKLSQGVPVD